MVRQWQELTYESRYSNSYSDSLPDFVRLAEAYGWKGLRIEVPADLDAGIAAMLAHDGPVMVDCRVAKEANCLPMIPSGAAPDLEVHDPPGVQHPPQRARDAALPEIGSAHVCTPVTNAHLVFRLLLEKK